MQVLYSGAINCFCCVSSTAVKFQSSLQKKFKQISTSRLKSGGYNPNYRIHLSPLALKMNYLVVKRDNLPLSIKTIKWCNELQSWQIAVLLICKQPTFKVGLSLNVNMDISCGAKASSRPKTKLQWAFLGEWRISIIFTFKRQNVLTHGVDTNCGNT